MHAQRRGRRGALVSGDRAVHGAEAPAEARLDRSTTTASPTGSGSARTRRTSPSGCSSSSITTSKDAPAPVWMVEGVPAVMKGKTLGLELVGGGGN